MHACVPILHVQAPPFNDLGFTPNNLIAAVENPRRCCQGLESITLPLSTSSSRLTQYPATGRHTARRTLLPAPRLPFLPPGLFLTKANSDKITVFFFFSHAGDYQLGSVSKN